MFQDIDPDILEAATLVENEYQEFFKSKLKEYGVESPADLDYEQSKAFFDEIRNEWGNGSVNESEEDDESLDEEDDEELNEGVEDVYTTIYNNLIKPNDLTVGNIVSFPYSGYDTDFKIELIVNPSCFGMPTIYHLKALNGPCKGDECVFEEEDLYNKLDNINESEEDEVEVIDREVDDEDEVEVNEEDELMDKIVEALENNSMFESDDEDELNESEEEVNEEDDDELNESEEESLDEEDEDKSEVNEEELEESTDFDITKENDKKLEEILKVFLKSKAMDGDDYEIVSKGNKLILKVYNDKFVKDIEKLLK